MTSKQVMSSNTEEEISELIKSSLHQIRTRVLRDAPVYLQHVNSAEHDLKKYFAQREATLKAEYEAKLEEQKKLLNFEQNHHDALKGIDDYDKFKSSEPNSPERIATFISQLSPWNLERGVQMLRDREAEYEEKVRETEQRGQDIEKVTRFEVIDHRECVYCRGRKTANYLQENGDYKEMLCDKCDGSGIRGGRVYGAFSNAETSIIKVELSYQDDGRTLKVFVSDLTQPPKGGTQ